MERGHLEMSEKERKRLAIMSRVKEGGMTIREGSEVFEDKLSASSSYTSAILGERGWGVDSSYVDRKTVYIDGKEPTVLKQLAGEKPLTQLGRACQKLGIEIVTANSPQAKGQVERKHGVYQDRLVKELRLEDIQDIPGANAFLAGYVDTLNGKFAHCPWQPGRLPSTYLP